MGSCLYIWSYICIFGGGWWPNWSSTYWLLVIYIYIYIHMHMRATLFLLWCLPARMALSPGTVATPTQQQSSEDRVSARHDSNSNSHINIFINCTLLISAPVKDFDWNTKYQTIHRVQFTYFGGAHTHNKITKTLSWDNRVWAQCHQAHMYIFIIHKYIHITK